MYWWFLIGAIAAEVFATGSLRAATLPASTWGWWVASAAGYVGAFALLAVALGHGAPLSTAYATWAGIGVALTAVVAWLVFSERPTLGSLVGIGLVVAGVVLIESSARAEA